MVLTTNGPVKAMILLFALCAAGGVSVRLFLNGKQEDKKEEDRE